MSQTTPTSPVLFHDLTCPWSRAARIACAEKNGQITQLSLSEEDRARGVVTPALMFGEDYHLSGGALILEFINDAFAQPEMVGGDAFQRAEVRRLTQLFADDFRCEVTDPLYAEKVAKPAARRAGLGHASADSRALKAALKSLSGYADYIAALYDQRRWLAGDLFSVADAMAAAQVSLLDLMNVIPWNELSTTAPSFKAWYVRVKSRPAFRAIIDDVLPEIERPKHYADPDF